MMAVLSGHDKVKKVLPELFVSNEINLAGMNFENHCVLSGTLTGLKQAESILKKERIASQMLPVKIAFHSHFMEPAYNAFIEGFPSLNVKAFQTPVYSALKNKVLENTDITPKLFWDFTRQTIDFNQTIKTLEKQNQNANQTKWFYIDCGPSGTLANFVKNITHEPTHTQIICSPFGKELENFQKVLEARAIYQK
jgi:malonyl CoA-acyl carrier protein transacylase